MNSPSHLSLDTDEIEPLDTEYFHMGYSASINRFLDGWHHRIKMYRDAYIKESVCAERAFLFTSMFVVVLSLFTASGNIYVMSASWNQITTFNIVVSCATIFLAVVLNCLRVWNIQEKRLIGHHTANRLSEIADDILLNQSLRSEKRLYAAVFIQNVVKRTESVLNASFNVSPIESTQLSERDRAAVLQIRHMSRDAFIPMMHTPSSPCTPNNTGPFINMTEEVHAATGVDPHLVLTTAHRHMVQQKHLIYVNANTAPVFTPPFSHAIYGAPADLDSAVILV